MVQNEKRFSLEIYDHYLSEYKPIDIEYEPTLKKALETALEIMAIDLSADRIMIFDKDKARANLVWNENVGDVEARGLRDEKKILAFGEEAVLGYFLRRK